MHQEGIYIIFYKKILQKLRGINKNYLFYGKFQKGIYTNILYLLMIISNSLITFFFYFRLETIHNAKIIHRDFHSGNILFDLSNRKRYQWQIGDLGLSQPVNNTSSNNEIYGVIPYIAPEIFKGSAFKYFW